VLAFRFPVEFSQQGELAATVSGMTTFKNVRFYYSPLELVNDLSIQAGWRAGYGRADGVYSADLAFTVAHEGTLTVYTMWRVTGAAGSNVQPSDFTLTDSTSSANWEVREVAAGYYLLIAKVIMFLSVGDDPTISLGAVAPAGFDFDGGLQSVARLIFDTATNFQTADVIHPNGQGAFISAADMPMDSGFTLNGTAAESLWKLSDVTVKGVWVANTLPVPGMNVYLDQDMPPFVAQYSDAYRVSPGYYDFKVAVGAGWFDATPASLDGNVENPPTGYPDGVGLPYASSMRQFSVMQKGTYDTYVLGYLVSSVPNYNLINSALQPQPTPFLCRRDTDVVPYSLGFNPNESVTKVSGTAFANKAAALNAFVPVPENATSIRIRPVESGTGKKAWVDGQISYGTPLNDLEVYVSKIGSINWNDPATYDFMIAGPEVLIPTDGGVGFIESVRGLSLNIAVLNPSLTDDVALELIIEIKTGPDKRQFFPVCRESFSYSIAEWPGLLRGAPQDITWDGYVGKLNKPVPQNGYCIYKLRATRMPALNAAGIAVTPASGAALTIEVGQNVLQADGSIAFTPFSSPVLGAGNESSGAGNTNIGAGGAGQDFSIVIPADARDSGDIDVFIPVLSGNEIVWRCEEQIQFEAWVNWQPIFFHSAYGLGPTFSDYTAAQNPEIFLQVPSDPYLVYLFGTFAKPTAFKYALNFTNFFDVTNSGYLALKSPYDASLTVNGYVQFPLSIETINDLTKLLNLL
jgi:hypothetical protein